MYKGYVCMTEYCRKKFLFYFLIYDYRNCQFIILAHNPATVNRNLNAYQLSVFQIYYLFSKYFIKEYNTAPPCLATLRASSSRYDGQPYNQEK